MAGAAEYRTEHVAETPRGWRVRMKAPGPQSQHLIGIAFPPGRRKKGSGKLIEILHPASERNPRCEISKKARENPGELLIFGNPHGRRVSRSNSGKRPGHKPGCKCFACRHARGEAVAGRSSQNNSKLAEQREARERAAKIRAARLARGSRFRDVGRGNPELFDEIRAGSRVTFVDKQAALRGEHKLHTGRAVMRSTFGGWVLNMGGPHGTPQVVNRDMVVRVKNGKTSAHDVAWQHQKKILAMLKKMPKPIRKVFDRNARRRRNTSDIDHAVNLYQSFHGRDPKSIVEEHVSAATRLDYTALGDLEYLEVKTPLGQKAKFEFPNDSVKLASSPDGKQLYCIGGNQNLLPCLDKDSQQKDFIDLGDGLEVQYLARKVHADFRPVSYFHKFGELNGARPRLMFDKLKKQIFFVGGEYFIDTSKGVSDGIEN